VAPLRVVRDQDERARVRGVRGGGVPEPDEQLGPGRGQVVAAREHRVAHQPVERGEPRRRTAGEPERRRGVERDGGAVPDGQQPGVQPHDLLPVRCRPPQVRRGEGCLEREAAAGRCGEGRRGRRTALVQRRGVPAALVLPVEQHRQPRVVGTGVPATGVQQAQRQQAGHLGLVGQQLREQPREVQPAPQQVRAQQESPDGAVCPTVTTRCTTVSTASSRSGHSCGPGTRYGAPEAVSLRLARVIRAVIASADTGTPPPPRPW
jgi:hypothetical protein